MGECGRGNVGRCVDFAALGAASMDPFAKELLEPAGGAAAAAEPGGGAGGSRAGAALQAELDELAARLDRTPTQYIRCIAPNRNQSSSEWDAEFVCQQLR